MWPFQSSFPSQVREVQVCKVRASFHHDMAPWKSEDATRASDATPSFCGVALSDRAQLFLRLKGSGFKRAAHAFFRAEPCRGHVVCNMGRCFWSSVTYRHANVQSTRIILRTTDRKSFL